VQAAGIFDASNSVREGALALPALPHTGSIGPYLPLVVGKTNNTDMSNYNKKKINPFLLSLSQN
jgi:hypothetical protein